LATVQVYRSATNTQRQLHGMRISQPIRYELPMML
jgi:hypothetical protein